HIIVLGTDEVGYGSPPKSGKTFREEALEKGDFDMSRLHFLGRVPYAEFVRVLQVSGVHIYLTVPFVLSWSMLEAMAAGCLVIGSRTAPVMEVIEHEKNGLLAEFFSPEEIADQTDRVLDHPDRMQTLREAARSTIIEGYDLKKCLQLQTRLISEMVKFARQGPKGSTSNMQAKSETPSATSGKEASAN
ncbi:MAG: glycosyltransferase, partial [Roseobacter sp.]|nr:glycosyltransferase [Roseobacter sp.]